MVFAKKFPGMLQISLLILLSTGWIKEIKDKPFFLVYQQKAPHRNWMPEEKYYHLFRQHSIPCSCKLF
jgi:hypothetical protein